MSRGPNRRSRDRGGSVAGEKGADSQGGAGHSVPPAQGEAFLATLRAQLGRESPPQHARDPVNQPMIRHWCDAMADHNPVYTDPGFARRSIHGGIVAPPTMLNAWTMPGYGRRRSDPHDPLARVLAELDAAGYTSVVATNSEHAYPRYLRLGEVLAGIQSVTDVSEAKHTALGRGHFVTTTTRYRNQHGEEVGRMEFRLLKFQPGTGRGAPAERAGADPAPRAPRRRDATLGFEEVEVGQALPPCPIPISATLIVAGAIASRDYQDVHHDRELALQRGSPDIFMNILTTGGLCGRYLSDWAGPEALLRSLRIRLGAPNYPHDTMILYGSVLSKTPGPAGGRIEVGLRGANRLGDHVTGRVELELPRTGLTR